jgi:TPP-dependent indolepyruvate ferredoxin oxidoreductase alpha subunit
MSNGRANLHWARQGTTKETMKDRERTEMEVAHWMCNGVYKAMKTALAGKNKKTLLNEAEEIASSKTVPKPQRLARRERPALISWFCQYCPERAQATVTESQWDSFEYFMPGDLEDF